MFYVCRKLTSITIGKSVTSIGGHAFYGCIKLNSITIPKSVNYIDSYAFDGCGEIIPEVYYEGSEQDWLKIRIDGHNSFLTEAHIHYNYNY